MGKCNKKAPKRNFWGTVGLVTVGGRREMEADMTTKNHPTRERFFLWGEIGLSS